MTDSQLDLFSRPPPRQRHSDTSIAAADRIEPAAGTLRWAVLTLLRAHPAGLTDEEMQTALGMNPSTQRPRRVELEQTGLVRDSGNRRQTASGRAAVVWQATLDKRDGRE